MKIFIKLHAVALCMLAAFAASCFIDDIVSPPNEDSYVPAEDEDKGIAKGNAWTVMAYLDGDNDLEYCLLNDVKEMKDGFIDDQDVNLIVLFDCAGAYSGYHNSKLTQDVFGSNFTVTRHYRIVNGKALRLIGFANGEMNMGDPKTLKNFIAYCKANYPAQNYALVISDHGSGPMKKSLGGGSIGGGHSSLNKGVCSDDTNGDMMLTGAMSDTLTSAESVDLLIMDACLMSSIEFAYQFRNDNTNAGFKAKYMVASAPTVWGLGLDYKSIAEYLCNNHTTAGFGAKVLGEKIVKIQKTYTTKSYGGMEKAQSFACLDMSKAADVKAKVDALATELKNGGDDERDAMYALRGKYSANNSNLPKVLHYFEAEYDSRLVTTLGSVSYSLEWLSSPFFDLYNLAKAINQDSSSNFSSEAKKKADAVMIAVDSMVTKSFANSYYTSSSYALLTFEADKSGMHIVFPEGEREYDIGGGQMVNLWTGDYLWYSSDSYYYNGTNIFAFGNLHWCKSGNGGTVTWRDLLAGWWPLPSVNP